MSNMSKIGELVSNIYQYGNSKFYLPILTNPRANNVLEFFVDEKGELQVTHNLEDFYTPFWDGFQKSEDAILKESIKVVEYTVNDLDLPISTIVSNSFFLEEKTILIHQEPIPVNTTKAVNKLYQMVYAMLQLSNADLTRWILSSPNGISNILMNKASQNIDLEEVSPEQAIENIEAMVKEVEKRLEVVEDVWDKAQTIYSDEEYETACKQWDSLYDDDVIPQFTKKS